jgi:hypothetical protein
LTLFETLGGLGVGDFVIAEAIVAVFESLEPILYTEAVIGVFVLLM